MATSSARRSTRRSAYNPSWYIIMLVLSPFLWPSVAQHGVHAAIVAMVTTTRRVPIKRAQVSPTQMVGLSTVISVGVVVTIQAVTVEHGLRHTIVHQVSNTWTACVREFSLAGAPQSQVQGALVNANT